MSTFASSFLQRVNSHNQNYNYQCHNWNSEPVYDRQFKDYKCAYTLLIFIMLFFGIGFFMIITQPKQFEDEDDINIFIQFYQQFLVLIFSSLTISLLFIVFIKYQPQIVVKLLIIISLVGLLALIILSIIFGTIGSGVFFTGIFIGYTYLVYQFRKQIQLGIALLRITLKFISQNPIIFLDPFLKILIAITFSIFWLYVWSIMQNDINIQQQQNENFHTTKLLRVVWIYLFIIFIFIIYYSIVFTISTVSSFWYYKIKQISPISTSYKWLLKSSFGPITYCSLLIPIVKWTQILRNEDQSSPNQNKSTCCLAVFKFILKNIYQLIPVLNNYGIIMMAITGKGFIESAQLMTGVLSQQLFTITKSITRLITFWAYLLAVITPTILGSFCIISQQNSYKFVIDLMVLLITLMVTQNIISIVIDSVSSIFVLYCIDSRFNQLQYKANNIEIQNILNQQLGKVIGKNKQIVKHRLSKGKY